MNLQTRWIILRAVHRNSLLRQPQETASPQRLSAEVPEPAGEHPMEAERENLGAETQSDPEGRGRDKQSPAQTMAVARSGAA